MIKAAEEALRKAMEGQGQDARGRLARVSERIFPRGGEPPSFVCPRCGARSFNPNDMANRYCGRCHVFVEEADDAP
jgi:hypothetical protein